MAALNKLRPVGLKHLTKGKHADGGGLYLLVTATGARYWRMKYRYGGRENTLAFGVYPEVALGEARVRRDAARELLRSGQDPAVVRQAMRSAEHRVANSGFGDVSRAWLVEKQRHWSPATFRKANYIVTHYLLPSLGSQDIGTLTASNAAGVLRAIEDRAPSLAVKARQYLQEIVSYSMREGLRDENRPLLLRGTLAKTRSRGHIAAATDLREARRLVRAIEAYPVSITRAALEMTMLTAARPGVVVAMRWDEVDFQNREWLIPAEKMKMRRAHLVPLPDQALLILRHLRQYAIDSEYVFPPLARQRSPHLSRDTLSSALRRMGLQGRHATHGFRAMLRTLGRERLGIPVDVLEAQLAHEKRGDVQRAYDRTQFTDERRVAMQEWANFIDSLRSEG